MPSDDAAVFRRDATAALDDVRGSFARWYERWQGASGQGYSDTDQALFDSDDVLREIEDVRDRWNDLSPPTGLADWHRDVAERLDDLVARLEELIAALDKQDFERLRVLSQATELSAHQLDELRELSGEASG